jgi:hypothetical protein
MKFINQSQIVGEKGVAAFYNYCVQHTPIIIFREESKNDFGIDGEIEFTKTDENNRKVVTGEILKIQIKSTETGSYISNNNENSFDFKARSEDIEYWKNHKIGVILVVYFTNTNELYARKISEIDYHASTTNKNVTITFHKKANLLVNGDNQFHTKYSNLFKSRVDYGTRETLYTNVLKFSQLPRYIYAYKSKISTTREIYDLKLRNQYPIFVIYSSKIYTFTDLRMYPDFIKNVLEDDSKQTLSFSMFLREKEIKNWGIELINKYFKQHCSEKGIWYNKDFNRYYFAKLKDDVIETEQKDNYEKKVFRKENNRSKKNRETEREVVTCYNYYGQVSFYRHFAFEACYFDDGQSLFLSITPKYFFTNDGRTVLDDPKRITQYTNYLTSKEYNQQVLNHVYFIVQYLANRGEFVISNYENCTISLDKLIRINVPFGIQKVSGQNSQKNSISGEPKDIQISLF